MKISGAFEFIERTKVKPPLDGVHVAGKDGWLKGSHAARWKGKLVPKGRVGMYVRNKQETGVKIFWSLSWRKGQKASYAKTIFRKWKKLHGLQISPKPHKIVGVSVNLTYRGKRHKGHTVGIKTDHVHYPEKAWLDYMEGRPYDWNAVDQGDHPLHTPFEFREFVRGTKRVCKKHGIKIGGSYKLGDVIYCTKKKRWYLVDIDLG